MVTVCAAAGIMACNVARDASSGAPSLRTEAVSWDDSVGVANAKAVCKIRVSYPEGGTPRLVDSVRAWIASRLSNNDFVGQDGRPPFVQRGMNLSDGRDVIDRMGKKVLSYSRRDLMDEAADRPGRHVRYEYYWDIEDAYGTDRFVTYTANTYCYLGGAHGGAQVWARVFRASDGREFGWEEMFEADALPAVLDMVRSGLMRQQFEVADTETLRDRLLVDPDSLPLPACAPYFMADGVHFVYQQYEIAPYAEGMPGCRLPYDSVIGYMTPEAAALIADTTL